MLLSKLSPDFINGLCQACKYTSTDFSDEPCNTCEITNYEPKRNKHER